MLALASPFSISDLQKADAKAVLRLTDAARMLIAPGHSTLKA